MIKIIFVIIQAIMLIISSYESVASNNNDKIPTLNEEDQTKKPPTKMASTRASKKKKKSRRIQVISPPASMEKKSNISSSGGIHDGIFSPPSPHLKAKDLFLGEYLGGKSEEEIKVLLKKGITFNTQKKEEEAYPSFEEAARYGSHAAMFNLGNYYRDKEKNQEEAYKWYFLGFQRYWETTGKIDDRYADILIKYKVREDSPYIALKSFFHPFDPNSSDDYTMFRRFNSVYQAYEKKFIETNLSEEELDLKKAHILNLISNILPSPNAIYLQAYYQRLIQLGVLYLNKLHFQDFEKIANLFERAKIPEGSFNLGLMYLNGQIGTELSNKDCLKKAEKLLNESGNLDAKCNLGVKYWHVEMGEDLTEEERYIKAAEYFQASNTAYAFYNLGLMYLKKLIGSVLSEQELESKAADLFEKSNIDDAKFRLGLMYLHGQAGKELDEQKRIRKAKQLLRESGTPDAQYNLGTIYLQEELSKNQLVNDISEELKEVAELFRKSNVPEALCNLGFMYLNGLIDPSMPQPQKEEKAEEFFKASQNKTAKNNLVILYIQQLFRKEGANSEELIPSLLEVLKEIGDVPVSLYGKAFLIAFFPEYMDSFASDQERYEQALKLAEEAQTEGVREAEDLIPEIEKMRKEEISEMVEEDIEADSLAKLEVVQLEKMQPAPSDLLTQQETEPLSKNAPFQTPNVKPSKQIIKPQKQDKETRRKKRFERFKEAFLKMKTIHSNTVSSRPISFDFVSETVHQDFKKFKQNNRKFSEILNDILEKPWGTEGSGKPEILKYNEYAGCYSRRFNGEDRLVYKYLPHQNKIMIFQCGQHY